MAPKGVVLFWFACAFAMARFGCGAGDETKAVRVLDLDVPARQSSPGLFDLAMVSVRGAEAYEVSARGVLGKPFITADDAIASFAAFSTSDRLAYAYSPLGVTLSKLYVDDRSGKTKKAMFESVGTIHSLAWSPGGNHLAFAAGYSYDQAGTWVSDRLYVLSLDQKNDIRMLRDYGGVKLRADMMHSYRNSCQLIWAQDEESLFWVSEGGKITQLDLRSGERTGLARCERLFAVQGGEFLVARANPWRLAALGREDGAERTIVVLKDVEIVGVGLLVPQTSIISLVVKERRGSKNPEQPTVFVDTRTGSVLGKIAYPVYGYLWSRK